VTSECENALWVPDSVRLHKKRLQRTTNRRRIHNIWTSCQLAVTYIMDKGPQSPEH
jgi:hypothetical protein